MTRPGLRWLLLWPIVATLSIGVAGLAFYVEQSVRADLTATVDDELRRAAANAAPPIGEPGPGQGGPGGAVGGDAPIQLEIAPSGEVTPINPVENPFGDAQLEELTGTADVRTVEAGARYRVGTTPQDDGSTLVTALSLETVDESIDSLRRRLVVGGLALFAAQCAVVWLIATRVAHPVSRLSGVSRRIADGELDTAIGPPRGSAETAALASDLERMVDRLRTMIAETERSAAEADAARRDMERFLADASHELRTPLTALRGYSDLHRRGMLTDDEAIDRAMGRIGSESARLYRLVVDLLDLVGERVDTERVDVVDLASAVIDDLTAAYPQRSVALRVRSLHPLVVLADPHRLHQALLNLGANACQHTPIGTDIEIEIEAVDAAISVAVVDHGPGLDPDLGDDLFRPFAKGDASRSRRSHDGAGLGLAIVERIIELHDGSITLEPTPGGGATFRLELPRSTARTDQG